MGRVYRLTTTLWQRVSDGRPDVSLEPVTSEEREIYIAIRSASPWSSVAAMQPLRMRPSEFYRLKERLRDSDLMPLPPTTRPHRCGVCGTRVDAGFLYRCSPADGFVVFCEACADNVVAAMKAFEEEHADILLTHQL